MWLAVGYNYLYVCIVRVLDTIIGKRKRQLPLVYVGEGSSQGWQRVETQDEEAHGQQRVEAQDEEVDISQEARSVASDDDKTKAPDT